MTSKILEMRISKCNPNGIIECASDYEINKWTNDLSVEMYAVYE